MQAIRSLARSRPPSDPWHDRSSRTDGGLSLGEGGDGSNMGTSAFSEGLVIASQTSDATDNLIQANLVTVYGQ